MEFDCLGQPIKETQFWRDREDKLCATVELYLVLHNGTLFPYGQHKKLLSSAVQSAKAQMERLDRLILKFGYCVPSVRRLLENLTLRTGN